VARICVRDRGKQERQVVYLSPGGVKTSLTVSGFRRLEDGSLASGFMKT
jgi:hypothetical protein